MNYKHDFKEPQPGHVEICTKCSLSIIDFRKALIKDERFIWKIRSKYSTRITEDDINLLMPCTLSDDDVIIRDIIE